MLQFPVLLIAAAFCVSASAAGGKNRLGDEDIEEGYQLCQKQGVEVVTIEENGIAVVIDCELAPGPEFPTEEE